MLSEPPESTPKISPLVRQWSLRGQGDRGIERVWNKRDEFRAAKGRGPTEWTSRESTRGHLSLRRRSKTKGELPVRHPMVGAGFACARIAGASARPPPPAPRPTRTRSGIVG